MTLEQSCIDISDISFSWQHSNNNLLNISSLSISTSESLFIHGPSGCGKSTLLSLLTGVLSPIQGDIKVLNQKFSQKKQCQRDQFRVDHFGIIFQQFNLIPYLNVLENVTLPLLFSKRRAARIDVDKTTPKKEASRLLHSLGLQESQIMSRNVTELSTGQQQRVAAARALIGTPEIIIADEPTSALDTQNKHGFIELLFKEIKKTKSTLIFVSHDISLLSHFDRSLPFEDLNK